VQKSVPFFMGPQIDLELDVRSAAACQNVPTLQNCRPCEASHSHNLGTGPRGHFYKVTLQVLMQKDFQD
jgi:hypothetical protein